MEQRNPISNNHQDDLNGGSVHGQAKSGSDPGSATNSQGVNQRWVLAMTGKGNAIRDEKGVKVFLTSSEDWLLTGNPSHRPSPPKGYCADHAKHDLENRPDPTYRYCDFLSGGKQRAAGCCSRTHSYGSCS